MEALKISDRQARTDHVKNCAQKMAATLVRAWREGERAMVRKIIRGAIIPRMGNEWQADVEALLDPIERSEFTTYMHMEQI